ncbi:MAG: hypothetical protein CBC48_11520 [bacterium TMED88]|nr:hypothetical protein [Deltaproteobacteria bacterium]OUV29743.1 MAG: hypothetical protein CBC48_11520 [bacterium TMED88]
MKKKIFDLRGSSVRSVIQLLKGVATDEGRVPFHEIHRNTLVAIAEHIFETSVDPDELDSDFASVQSDIEDNELRHEITHMASVLPYLEPDSMTPRAGALERLASSWGVADVTIKGAMDFARNKKTLIYLDSFRTNIPEMGHGLLSLYWGFFKSGIHRDGDAKRLARHEAYRSLPVGTLGHAFAAYYDDNKFPLPGTAGAAFSNNLSLHDIHHILAGYDTSPSGELCVYAFDGALSRRDYSSALVGSVAQYQLGYARYTDTPSWRNQFDPEMIYRAAERGHGCRVNYVDQSIDFYSLRDEPLAEVRERFGIDPEGALVRTPADPWCGPLGPPDERENPNLLDEGIQSFE